MQIFIAKFLLSIIQGVWKLHVSFYNDMFFLLRSKAFCWKIQKLHRTLTFPSIVLYIYINKGVMHSLCFNNVFERGKCFFDLGRRTFSILRLEFLAFLSRWNCLTLFFIMLKNDQIYFKNLSVFIRQDF